MTPKSTWWAVTAYNAEMEMLEKAQKGEVECPDYVRRIVGGREKCPTTDRLHFQGAIQMTKQLRFSTIKEWLPTAHLETARKEWCLQSYVMKKATSVGPKVNARVNEFTFISPTDLLDQLVAYEMKHPVVPKRGTIMPKWSKDYFIKLCQNFVLDDWKIRKQWRNQLCDPRFERLFKYHFHTTREIILRQRWEDEHGEDENNLSDIQPASQTETAQGVGGSEGTRFARDPESQGLGEEALVADEPRSRRSEGDDADPLAERSDLNEAGQGAETNTRVVNPTRSITEWDSRENLFSCVDITINNGKEVYQS